MIRAASERFATEQWLKIKSQTHVQHAEALLRMFIPHNQQPLIWLMITMGLLVIGCQGASPVSKSKQRAWEVVDFGGYFFEAEKPKSLRDWYKNNLGFEPEADGTVRFWVRHDDAAERRAYVVWAPFSKDTTYFHPSTKPFMFNYRVRNLDAMLADLRAKGVQVVDRIERYDYGRFAWIMDPEGNRIELWEPTPGWEPKLNDSE